LGGFLDKTRTSFSLELSDESPDDLTNDMIVIEPTFNPESAISPLGYRASHFSHALNSQLFVAIRRRGDKHLDPYVRSNRRTVGTTNKCSVQRNIVRKTTFGEVATINPMEDDGKMESVPHGRPTLNLDLN
jgi:hypothetical protein